jgi:hypothetical protein
MQPIHLIGEHGGIGAKPLGYAPGDLKKTFWGEFPNQGTLKGSLCPECGRVILHAEKTSRS